MSGMETAIFSAMAGSLFSSMLSGGKESPPAAASAPAPAIPPPTPMPVPDDAAVAAAKKRSIAAQLQRRGRASTILTDPVTGGSDALGG